MILIKKFKLGEIETNSYLVYDSNTNDAVIIDAPCGCKKEVYDSHANLLNIKAVLLTHGHFDHIANGFEFVMAGIDVAIHELDKPKCRDNKLNLSINMATQSQINPFNPTVLFYGKSGEFQFGSIKGSFIHTPGHSDGSIVYVIDKYLFSGDTVFDFGYGRTDFYDGSAQKLRQSIRKINDILKKGYILCPGHWCKYYWV